jgi:hypothetical protein
MTASVGLQTSRPMTVGLQACAKAVPEVIRVSAEKGPLNWLPL